MFVILDVDHTLLKENISFLFGKKLFQEKRISFFKGVIAAFICLLFRFGILSQELLHRVLFDLLFKGYDKASFQELFCHFFAENKHTLVRYSLLEQLKSSAENKIALFSSSPDFMVEEIGKSLGIGETYGSQYNVNSIGRFSSLGTIMTGENKAAKVLLKPRPLVVYTDSSDDIPLLEIADFPVAVCPDRRLFHFAQKKGWDILFPVER